MTRSIAPEEIAYCLISDKPRRNQLTARWLIIDGKLICKWFIE